MKPIRLDPAYLKQINAALDNLARVEEFIAKCAACGLQTDKPQALLEEQRNTLLAFKQQFFSPLNEGRSPEALR